MQTSPFWTDQYPRPPDLPISNDLPNEVDVVVVGSGYTGLNAARVLALGGMDVAVMEQETIGWGASSRNGGMALPGFQQDTRVLFKKHGEKLGRELWQASLDAVDLVESLIGEEHIDCDYVANGKLSLAHKPSHFDSMRGEALWYRQNLGYVTHVISREELSSEVGSSAFYGGVLDECGGGLHPAKYVFGLARAATKYGVRLCEETTVERIDKAPHLFEVKTSRGVTRAHQVVMATNGYTTHPKVRPGVIPIGSYIIVSEPLSSELQAELIPNNRMLYDTKNLLNYFRLTADGRLIWGGRNDLKTDLDPVESARRLTASMLPVFPQLEGVNITHSWTGNLGVSFDKMPHVGQVDGIYYALGYGGHGVAMASYLGVEIAELILGHKTRSPFMEIPHPKMFFYRKETWFLPLAAIYFRFLDAVS